MELREAETNENTPAVPAYAPTQEEKRTLAAHRRRVKHRAPSPCMKVEDQKTEGGKITRQFGWKHPNMRAAFDLFAASINSVGNEPFVRTLLLQLAEATADRNSLAAERDEEAINFCLPVLQGINPKDEIEVMLASQMAITHCTYMRMAAKHAAATDLVREESFERQVNRFARTFTAQMQALKVYRAKGKQSIVVKHVTVSHGSQAIIGNVKGRGKRGRGADQIGEATS